jgi:RNA polymerase sigma-70 factor, ECF subfamily
VAVDDFDDWYGGLRPAMGPALAAWCGDPSVAADALDEAFTRAVERWERVSQLDAPAGWVGRTATNVARRRVRRRNFEDRLLRRAVACDPRWEPQPVDLDLVTALQQLSDRQRTAVVLHYIADLPLREVAAAMGVANGTVAATLHQARARLATLLEASTATSEPSPSRVDGGPP